MTKQIDREKLIACLKYGLSLDHPDISIQLLLDHIEAGQFDSPEAPCKCKAKEPTQEPETMWIIPTPELRDE